jgi:hypothetical protein
VSLSLLPKPEEEQAVFWAVFKGFADGRSAHHDAKVLLNIDTIFFINEKPNHYGKSNNI